MALLIALISVLGFAISQVESYQKSRLARKSELIVSLSDIKVEGRPLFDEVTDTIEGVDYFSLGPAELKRIELLLESHELEKMQFNILFSNLGGGAAIINTEAVCWYNAERFEKIFEMIFTTDEAAVVKEGTLLHLFKLDRAEELDMDLSTFNSMYEGEFRFAGKDYHPSIWGRGNMNCTFSATDAFGNVKLLRMKDIFMPTEYKEVKDAVKWVSDE